MSLPTSFVAAIPPRRSGFTIVEMLVVITIMALLVSLLLPSMQAARKTSQLVLERGNMRQVGMGVFYYGNDFQNRLPGGGGEYGGGHHCNNTCNLRSLIYSNNFYGGGNNWNVPGANTGYLASDDNIVNAIGRGWTFGGTSKIWGCPVSYDIGPNTAGSTTAKTQAAGFRYATSWWWNVGQENACDANGKAFNLVPPPAYVGNTPSAPAWTWSETLYVDGKGFIATPTSSAATPNNIQIISDSGGGSADGYPQHIMPNTTSGIPEGCNALFLDGHGAWRQGSTMTQNLWFGGSPYGWR